MTETLTLEEADVQEDVLRARLDRRPAGRAADARAGRGDARGRRASIDEHVLIGFLPARGRGVTLEKAAINAVMAGCKPEYFPVVVAALEAMFDAAFNLHTVLTSTGGAALCAIVVSGPIAQEIGMNARHNALGPGNRANATIGRALRLVGDERARRPARRVRRVVVRPPRQVHALLRRGSAARAVAPAAATSSATTPRRHDRHRHGRVEGPHQLAQQLNGDAEGVLRSFAALDHASRRGSRPARAARRCSCSAPSTPASASPQGWTQARVREFVCARGAHRRRRAARRRRPDRGRRPARDDARRRRQAAVACRAPDDVLLVTAGGEGAGWSAWLPVVGADDPRPARRRAASARPASRCRTAGPTAASSPGCRS